ncbi:putative AMP dependent ligase/synthetase [Talaromyces proteolyticus]|uniref:AMP dependent ligase/synthetase n=1 Tax=Talaromyces proteolyticus TaxID=1131652 RepID=A0AAD4KYS1_9EURO|nr:putative AMP dependent ligase/synthetase [Talaromyces proteolyticus]KAH8703109.1 putative AMP dependent ligase/synthetase [Talaromyces proteolyticus]
MGKGDSQSDSQQLLPVVLKNRAQQNPQGAWAQFPVSDQTYASGLQTATNWQVNHAVNRVAWLLDDWFGASSDFETLAYIGPFDLRYYIIVIAAIKVGYKTFLPSPRNSKVAQLHLIQQLKCTKLVTADPQPAAVNMVLEELPMATAHIPSLRELLNNHDEHDEREYPYEKSYDEANDEPIFILHTSGSTGIPKPLIYTHRFITRTVNVTALAAPVGFRSGNDNIRTGHWFTFLAPFHISGMGFGLMVAAFNDCVPVFPLPGQPLTTAQFVDAVKHVDMDWAFVLPFILEDLSKDPMALELVSRKLSHLYFAGGSVPQAAGNIVTSKIPVYQTTGSSEMSLLSQIHSFEGSSSRLRDDWAYIHLHPTLNAEYRHHYGDLYEMVIVKSPESEEFQPIFLHFPDREEYETRDLLSPHPTVPGMWRYRGRKDDIIVFLNGEKTNPISFEQEVSRHPEVRSALVAGSQRFEACLLVELHQGESLSKKDLEKVVNSIWPAVQTANSECPAHARVSKANILVVNPSKPMARAAKGTVQRAATLALYEEEINKLYAEKDFDNSLLTGGRFAAVDKTNLGAVSRAVRELVYELISFHWEWTLFTTIYNNPSVNLLSKAAMSQPIDQPRRTEAITSLLQHYEKQIDNLTATAESDRLGYNKNQPNPNEGAVVALTGSTGAVGSYILQKLLQSDGVTHVYCLNRAADSKTLQHARNIQRRIKMELSCNRVTFLQVDLAQPNFAIHDTDLYLKMQRTVTHFIHNAWPVNFNQTLQSFRPSLDGVLGLISFAARASCLVSTLYLSSISAVSNYHLIAGTEDDNNLIPEEIIDNPISPAAMGYGESKYLAERILDYASEKLQLKNFGIARVGQIAGTSSPEQGPAHGWNRHEWLPSLVISSRYLNAIPESLGSKKNEDVTGVLDRIDWVPIDHLASLLVEILFSSGMDAEDSPGARVFHPINPNWISWQSLVPTVVAALKETSLTEEIKVVKYEEWLALLQFTATATKDLGESSSHILRENPAVKLLEFYQSIALNADAKPKPLELTQTLEKCPSLQKLGAIRSEWLCGWIKDWILVMD